MSEQEKYYKRLNDRAKAKEKENMEWEKTSKRLKKEQDKRDKNKDWDRSL